MQIEDVKHDLEVLFTVYAYSHAKQLLVGKQVNLNQDFLTLLHLMRERTKLNIEPLFDKEIRNHFKAQYDFIIADNQYEEELLANYIMVLESQLKIGDTIDFVRAVSPIIYRLFLRLLRQEVPELMTYLHNARDDRYDTWLLDKMSESDSEVLKVYSDRTGDARVTSKSLHDMLLLCDLPNGVKQLVKDLRRFEKSVRNPLAHLIKPFDEAELYRTTAFSSKDFLEKIVDLAIYTGVAYDKRNFYYDKANQLLLKLLDQKTSK